MTIFRRSLLLLFMITFLCVSCAPNGIVASTVSPSIPPTNTVIPSSITPSISSTTNTPTEILIPTPTLTEIFIPTLSAGEVPDHLLELIKSNGNCLLPCWIGIVPGASTNSTIFSILSPYTGIAIDGYFPESDPRSLDFLLKNDKNEIHLEVILDPVGVDQTREMISVHIQQIQNKNNSPYLEIFKLYSLQNILKIYGNPSTVGLNAFLHKYDPNSVMPFEMYLTYPEKGIYIRYTTVAEEIFGDQVRSCLSEAHIIDLWLTKPDVNNENMKLLTDLNMEWSYSRTSLQDATQMSIDQFFENFKSQPDQCLITPKSIWTP